MKFGMLFALSAAPALVAAQTVVEYVNTQDFSRAPGGQYFYSADVGEQAYVDSGAAGAFKRTGAAFLAGGAKPLCRFYGSVTPGPNSHFYTIDAGECSGLKAAQISPKPAAVQQWNFESDGFKATPPENGQCPTGTLPVTRVYNNAFAGGAKNAWDSNHRFASSRNDVDYLINRHKWKDEGVQFCVQADQSAETIVPASSVAQKCDDDSQKRWLRAFTDERYLWYNEIPKLASQTFATPLAYYEDLKSWVRVGSGAARDRFHFSQSTESYLQSSQGISSAGYGLRLAFIANTAPRLAYVAYVEPQSPAALAGVARGMEIVSIDGVSVATGSATALNAGLLPKSAGESHVFSFVNPTTGQTLKPTLISANVQSSPVHTVKTIPTDGGKVGYILFNAFNLPAEGALAAAFNQLKADNVTDLVLDMRYNGGGRIYIASELAYMIAGEAKRDQLFATLQYSDKRSTDTFRYNFDPTASGASGTNTVAGAPLPTLNLTRVFILTGAGTASASELVINGLRGAGITVHLIGSQTVGKPFGFTPTDNCGTTYSSIEFVSNNAQGVADFEDGFAPTCALATDDFSKPLGDERESRLAAALALRTTGQCPANAGAPTDHSKRKRDQQTVAERAVLLQDPLDASIGNLHMPKPKH